MTLRLASVVLGPSIAACNYIYHLSLSSGVVGDDVITMSVMEGDSVALYSGVTKQQRDKMLWYFNNTLIASVETPVRVVCIMVKVGCSETD